MSKRSGICAYCGVAFPKSNLTKDHVPPRALFLEPLPEDLVTVPACRPCNERVGKLAEWFRFYLSLILGLDTPERRRLWKERALPSARHNRALHSDALENLREADVTTPGGLFLGRVGVSRIDRRRHDEFIRNLVKGLYFREFDEPLGAGATIDIYAQQDLEEAYDTVRSYLVCRTIGKKQFVYMVSRADDESRGSVWVFRFHGGHTMMAATLPVVPLDRSEAIPFSTWPRA